MPRLSRPQPARPAKRGTRRATAVAVVRGSRRNPTPVLLETSAARAKRVARWLGSHFPGAKIRVQNAAPESKSVGGRAVARKWFAFVGDPNRTATWKLPIKDAGHVRDALARFGRTALPRSERAAVLARIRRRARELGIRYAGEAA